MGAANADTASAAKLRLCLSALLNDLDMKNSPMGFENTLEILLLCPEQVGNISQPQQYFQRTPLMQGYKESTS
jgi:hypothetical protein